MKSILFFLICFSSILLSGWVRATLNKISFTLGNSTPIIYFSFGMGCGLSINSKELGQIITHIVTIICISLLTNWSMKYLKSKGQSEMGTVPLCGAGFIMGGIMGIILNFLEL